jgi:hypothetical protein
MWSARVQQERLGSIEGLRNPQSAEICLMPRSDSRESIERVSSSRLPPHRQGYRNESTDFPESLKALWTMPEDSDSAVTMATRSCDWQTT